MCLMPYAYNKVADQPVHPISTFIVCCLDSIITKVAVSTKPRLVNFRGWAVWFESYLVAHHKTAFSWHGFIIVRWYAATVRSHMTGLLKFLFQVRNSESSWRDTRKQLRKDHRWELANLLEREEKEKLFEVHLENLTKKNREMFHKLLDETPEVRNWTADFKYRKNPKNSDTWKNGSYFPQSH